VDPREGEEKDAKKAAEIARKTAEDYKMNRKLELLQAELLEVQNDGSFARPAYDEEEHGVFAVKVMEVEAWNTQGRYLGSD
jgi:hypothetical protein